MGEGGESKRGKIASTLRALLPALLMIPAIVWVWDATVRASWSSLGRDQGIFQYVAWAVGQGDVAYRDVRDVNGPVITIVHTAFQLLGGGDEHRFRVLDLVCTGLSFAIAGGLMPSIVSRRQVALYERLTWALAAWVVLSAQYAVYGFWDTAQRESFLDWFVLVSISLQATSGASGDVRSRTTRAVLALSGLLSFIPWLGKPTYVLFTIPQLLALVLERGALRERAQRVGLFIGGGIFGLALPLLFVLRRGDLQAWGRITFIDVPTMYRFIWHRPPSAILSLPGYSTVAMTAGATSAVLVAFIALRRVPVRILPIALMPVLGLASVVAQAKGFPYHFHPVTLGTAFGWLVALATAWELIHVPARRSIGGLMNHEARAPGGRAVIAIRVGVILASAFVSGRAAYFGWLAPHPPPPAADARDSASLESAERLSAFDRVDYFPRAMRDAASYVAAHTRPNDRVQTYAMDAYLLFLAGRRSATPYIYAYDLNADAAMHGSFDPGGLVPTPAEVERIRALRDAHAHDLAVRLERSPPAAFIFADRSPLMSYEDSYTDFAAHCPETAAWVSAHYQQTAEFEGIRVWLPRVSEQ